MTNKKIILSIGTIVSVAAPVAASVSCSTTWTSWSKKEEPQTKTKFKGSDTIERIKYKVRLDSELMNAWDANTNTLDVDKINNQFELVKVLSNILSIASTESIDSYWNNFTKMKGYLSSIVKTIDINLSYRGKTKTLHWDATTVIENAIKGIDEYNLLATQSEKDKAKAFNVEEHGLKDNTPVDFGPVAQVGSPLTSNPTVSELMSFDIGFSLALSKLVNLPLKTFTEFTHLLTQIDTTLNSLWGFISESTFIEDKGLDFSISTTGKIGIYDIEKKFKERVTTYQAIGLPIPGDSVKQKDIDEFRKGYLKAQFIIQALKH